MNESAQSWRKKLRLQKLVEIANQELKSGTDFDELYDKLDAEMQRRWKLVPTTRKKYLDTLNKIFQNQYVLVD